MIISRTPFRISFFGGGTDYPIWYKENGGAVLSTTINKYCYISCRYLPPFFDHKYRIRYTKREEAKTIAELKHPAVRECIKYLKIDKGIEMVHTSDLPARTGIASSAAFTVGFLNTLYALTGKLVTKRQLARQSIYIEQELIKENVGSQDQVAVAFGGFNKIEFGGHKDFYVRPITVSEEKINIIQDHLMLFFTGFSRTASQIAREQIKKAPSQQKELKAMGEMVEEGISILNGRSEKFDNFGRLLHESWKIKRSLTSKISNPAIDEIYNTAMSAGALGGKLLGAGGGGFIMFFVRPEQQRKVKEKLKKLLYVPIKFDKLGSQIIYYAPSDNF